MQEKCASGKLGPFKHPDHAVNRAFAAVDDAIKAKVEELKGAAPESLEVIGYKDQKVVGINLFVKVVQIMKTLKQGRCLIFYLTNRFFSMLFQIKIDKGPDYIHAKMYQPIEGEPCLIDTTGLKLESDEIEYF